jgi:hypothetical protein
MGGRLALFMIGLGLGDILGIYAYALPQEGYANDTATCIYRR